MHLSSGDLVKLVKPTNWDSTWCNLESKHLGAILEVAYSTEEFLRLTCRAAYYGPCSTHLLVALVIMPDQPHLSAWVTSENIQIELDSIK